MKLCDIVLFVLMTFAFSAVHKALSTRMVALNTTQQRCIRSLFCENVLRRILRRWNNVETHVFQLYHEHQHALTKGIVRTFSIVSCIVCSLYIDCVANYILLWKC